MSKVYVVQRECGDYYCGCGGGHVVGVFDDKEGAELIASGLPKYESKVTPVDLNMFRWQRSTEANDYTSAWT